MTFSCKVKAQEADLKIVCTESNKKNDEYSESIILKTCEFKNHLFKSTGIADYKSRYSYKYELFQINENDTIKVKNSNFFNQKAIELEKLINDKLKTEYESNSKIPETSQTTPRNSQIFYNIQNILKKLNISNIRKMLMVSC